MLETYAEGKPSMPEEIDLRELFHAIVDGKWIVALVTAVGVALAVAYAVLAPKSYESSVFLIPTEAPKADQLGAAAALLGKKSGNSGDLDLYQTLLTSRKVLRDLLRSPVRNLSDTGRGRIEPASRALGVDTASPLAVVRAVEGLSKSIEVSSLGGAGGILQVKLTAREPWLAQQLADAVVAICQDELRAVRADRSNAVLGRIEAASASAKGEWESAARSLVNYRDRNPSLYLPGQQLDLERLALEKQVKEQKYLLARREVEQQLLEREKAIPPALVMDSADLPARKSGPKRVKIVALGLVASLFAGCALVVARRVLTQA